MPLKKEHIIAALQLKGLGRRTAHKLCLLANDGKYFTDKEFIEFIYATGETKSIPKFQSYSKLDISEALEHSKKLIQVSEDNDIGIVSFHEDLYPETLKMVEDPPILMYYKGNIKELSPKTGVAIIGTREPTENGIKAGEYFGAEFGKRNFNVVSGLAVGCDSSAHRGCLKVSGYTTAVLAHGFHTIYPKENKVLALEILENNGLLLTEYPFGTDPRSNYFVERDRIQSGLSEATIVIQTDIKGGTMHAVNDTIKHNKLLAAVKYKGDDLLSVKTNGNEMLIESDQAYSLSSDKLEEFLLKLINKSLINSEVETSKTEEKITIVNKEENKIEVKDNQIPLL